MEFDVGIQRQTSFQEVPVRDKGRSAGQRWLVNKQVRLRYRALANIPLTNATMKPKTIYISVRDEIFMSRVSMVTYDEPDQNRLFVGPGYQFTKKLAVQAGYFYQFLVKSNGAKQENNFGPLLQLNYNFDFRRSKSVGNRQG